MPLTFKRTPYRYRRHYLNGLDPKIAMVVENPVVQKTQVLMDYAEQVEVRHKRKGQQERSRSVRPKTSKLANEIKPTGKAATSTPSSRKEVGSKASWWCNRCNLPHPEDKCRFNNRACFNCGSEGHWKRDCPKLQQETTWGQ